MLQKSLLEKVEYYYNIPKIVACEKIDKGFLTDNYKLSTENEVYFLKKYRADYLQKVPEIHSVKTYFDENGIPVIMPLRSIYNETYFENENSAYALFPFVYGVQPERGMLSEQMIISLGKMLGRIHLLGRDNPIKIREGEFKGWNKKESLQTIEYIEDKIYHIKEKTDFDILAQKMITLKKTLSLKMKFFFLI